MNIAKAKIFTYTKISVFALAVVIAVLILLSNIFVLYSHDDHLYSGHDEDIKTQTVMILGARVYGNERLSAMYYDRAKTALDIYKNGLAEKILVSGDHGSKSYDEVNAVKDFLLEEGVPGEDIFLDHAGFDTYDSMYRARDIFEVKDLIVVTQAFHLPRAVYIARELGIEAVGISADRREYRGVLRNELRESLARVKAFVNVLFASKPRYLGEPIPITGDSELSWD